MLKLRFLMVAFMICSIIFVSDCLAQDVLSVKELVEKNVQAAGGAEKLDAIKNFTFTLGLETIYVTTDERMKITAGKAPVITEITLVNKNTVVKNCFNDVTELEGSTKSTYQILTLLRSGLYTISKLEHLLKPEGVKQFGPKTYHVVSAQLEGLKADFYLDSDEFIIKRIVFQGQDTAGEEYEMSQDFGPYKMVDGVNLPTTWYTSHVGTRGETHTMENVKFNQSLNNGLFANYIVNVGEVKVAMGDLSGQIVDVERMGDYLIVYTNWTPRCIQQAGFQPKEKLMLDISNKTIEVVLEENQPSRTAMATVLTSMFPSSSGTSYVILFAPSVGNEISESLAPLKEIHIKRKV